MPTDPCSTSTTRPPARIGRSAPCWLLVAALLAGCPGPEGTPEDVGAAGSDAPLADVPIVLPDAPRDGSVTDTGGATGRPWCDPLAPNTWTELPDTSFLGWAPSGIPDGAYRGTAPFGSIVDAYSDPATDGSGRFYFYGGGHGDGTCNGVIEFDPIALSYSLVASPTPPSVYLPDYLMTTSPISYPSGTPFSGWFLSADELPDPADAAYRAPGLARVSTHMYAAAAMRGSVIHYFYSTYGELDVATGTWSGREVDLGAQLLTFRPEYGSVPLQQGTVAIYDAVTDRFFVTLNPGDAGGGWRSAILVFDPTTRRIESIHEIGSDLGGPMTNSPSIVVVGRRLFVFTQRGLYLQPQIMHQGFIFDMDARTYQRFVLDGDPEPSTYVTGPQETIPAFFDGTSIRRWNYTTEHRNELLRVSVTPTSGTGTETDPLVLHQTIDTLSGAIDVPGVPPEYHVMYVYRRFVYDAASGCALVLPRADSNWYGLRVAP